MLMVCASCNSRSARKLNSVVAGKSNPRRICSGAFFIRYMSARRHPWKATKEITVWLRNRHQTTKIAA